MLYIKNHLIVFRDSSLPNENHQWHKTSLPSLNSNPFLPALMILHTASLDVLVPVIELLVIPPIRRPVDPLALVLPPEPGLERRRVVVLRVHVLGLPAVRPHLLLPGASLARRVEVRPSVAGVRVALLCRCCRRVRARGRPRAVEVEGRQGETD